MEKKIIAITGGTGFVGQQLALRLISMGNEVRILSRKKNNSSIHGIKFFQGDLTSYKDSHVLREFCKNVDIVFNCAAELKNEKFMHALHIEGTKRLLNISKNKISKWIQLSSVGVYGWKKQGVIKSTNFFNPQNIYEKTKLVSDELVENSGINSIILRPSIILGKKMKSKYLTQIMKVIKKNLFFYFDPKAKVNFVHVDDVVNALILCGESTNNINTTYLLSDSTSVEKMVASISVGMSVKPPSFILPKLITNFLVFFVEKFEFQIFFSNIIKSLSSKCTYDSSPIQEELGFKFTKDLEVAFKNYAKDLK